MYSIGCEPEKFDLVIVDILGNGGYSWDEFGIWTNRDGTKLYWQNDSGCSCNSPFDMGVDDLNTGTSSECEAALDEWAREAVEYGYVSENDVTDAKVKLTKLNI